MNIDNRLTIYGFDEQDETILNNRISKFGLTSVPAKAIAVYEIGSPNAADVTATLYNNGLLEFEGGGDIVKFSNYSAPWYDYKSSITSVSFKTGNTIKPTSTAYLFQSLNKVTSIDLFNLDTSNVTDMEGMFSGCIRLHSLDLSSFDTSKVTNMNYMFQTCSSLESLDLSSFDTSNVTNMTWMFNGCESLIKIKGSENLVSSKVTTMERIFNYCISLSSLETSNWNTSNVSIMAYMFDGCKSLTSLDLSSFNTSKVKSMDYMFYGCESLTEIIGLDNFDTSKVTSMNSMFYECNNLSSSITIMCADTIYFRNMFTNCSIEPGTEFIVKYIDNDTKSIAEAMVATKYPENSNVVLYIPPANLINGQDFNTAIESFGNIDSIQFLNEPPTDPTPGDILLVSEATSPVKAYMAQLATGGIIVYPEEAGSPLVANESCYRMFHGTSVTSINFNNFDTSNVTKMNYMFYNCASLTSLDLSNWDTSNVTNMRYMFSGCKLLTSLDLSSFDTSNVTNMMAMFSICESLTSLDLSEWNTSKVANMTSMFIGCADLVSSITIMNPNITVYSSMFSNCSTKSNSIFVVNYTEAVPRETVEAMVATKSTNSKVFLSPSPLYRLGNYWVVENNDLIVTDEYGNGNIVSPLAPEVGTTNIYRSLYFKLEISKQLSFTYDYTALRENRNAIEPNYGGQYYIYKDGSLLKHQEFDSTLFNNSDSFFYNGIYTESIQLNPGNYEIIFVGAGSNGTTRETGRVINITFNTATS